MAYREGCFHYLRWNIQLRLRIPCNGLNIERNELGGIVQNTSSAIGQLVLVYKRVTALAGYTSRVSELLESVSIRPSFCDVLPGMLWHIFLSDGL